MSRPRLWIALGLGAFFLLLLVTFPAQPLFGQLERLGVQASGVSGSLWKGQAAALRVGSLSLGQLTWDLHVLKLLTGQASASVSVKQGDAFAQGDVSTGLTGHITLSDVTASWPLAALAAAGMPAGWNGLANLRLAELEIEGGIPVDVTGTIDLMNLVGPANRPASLGSFQATFPAASASTHGGEGLDADLKDLEGPIEVVAILRVGRDRSYVIEGQIATRPNAPSQVVSALQYLGEPDAQGRRPFSVAGTF
jgi:general secretion pathway protein N